MIQCAIVCDEADKPIVVHDFSSNVYCHGNNICLTFLQATNESLNLMPFDVVLYFNGVMTSANYDTCDAVLYKFVTVQQKSLILCCFSNKNGSLGLQYQVPQIHPFRYSSAQLQNKPIQLGVLPMHKKHAMFSKVKHVELNESQNTITDCKVAQGAIQYAEWSNHSCAIAERKMSMFHTVVALNLHPTSCNVHYGNMAANSDGFLLIYNTIVYCASLNGKVWNKMLHHAKQYADVVMVCDM